MENNSTLPKAILDSFNRKFNSKISELTIHKAALKWPLSKSRAFIVIGKGENNYYFLLEKPERSPIGNISCTAKCIKFHKESGQLMIVNLTVYMSYEINAITFKEFDDLVREKYQSILTDQERDPDATRQILIERYEELGFNED